MDSKSNFREKTGVWATERSRALAGSSLSPIMMTFSSSFSFLFFSLLAFYISPGKMIICIVMSSP